MTLRMRSAYTAISCALLTLFASGCSGEDESSGAVAPPQTFIGELQGSDAVIAIVEEDASWIAYVCGGPLTYATLTRWFAGTSRGGAGEATLRGVTGGASLVADGVAGAREGTITSGDVSLTFRADRIPTSVSRVPGLFSAIDSGCRAGLVVMPEGAGSTPRMQGVWCDDAGRFGQVTPIMPLTVRGERVAVHVGEPARQLYMQPVVRPLDPADLGAP